MMQPPNAWVSSAKQLLAAAVRIRVSHTHPDPAGLLDALDESLARCGTAARQDGVDEATWSCVRSLISRRLDDAVAATTWGAAAVPAGELERRSGPAATDSQIVALVDAWSAARDVDRHAERDAMDVLHAALALDASTAPGRVEAQALDLARHRLGLLLRAPAEPGPVPDGPRDGATRPRLSEVMPVWVLASMSAVALTLLFVALRISINADSDPVFAGLRAIDVSAADLPASSPALSPAVAAALAPRLATFLKQDIDAGLVLVNDMPDKSVITIRGDSFFEPGSAVVADPARMFPLMGRIAAGLNAVPGQALVAGYTDAQHDHSVLYPSNWHLSQDRANAVMNILAESVDPGRLTAQGRADSEPVHDGSSPQGRADNRRVDITLVVGQPS